MIHHRTPCLPSTALAGHLGRPVWLKLECAQPCGSFKLRGMAISTGFTSPHDLVVGADGTVYVADIADACVRAIRPDGALDTVAGACGEPGDLVEGSEATGARFRAPAGIALDDAGGLWVADVELHVVVRIPGVDAQNGQ